MLNAVCQVAKVNSNKLTNRKTNSYEMEDKGVHVSQTQEIPKHCAMCVYFYVYQPVNKIISLVMRNENTK